MKKEIYTLIWAMIVMLTSCAQDNTTEQQIDKNDVQITLALSGAELILNGRADVPGTPEEDVINSVQLFFSVSGTFVNNIYLTAQEPNYDKNTVWDKMNNKVVLRNFDKSKTYTIYAVINHNKIDATTDVQLKEVFTHIENEIDLPTLRKGLIMSGTVTNCDFTKNDNNVTIDLIRQVAKMELYLRLDPNFFAAYPTIEWASNKDYEPKPVSIFLYNLANNSYIFERPDHKIPLTGLQPIHYDRQQVKTVDGSWPVVYGYIYENHFVDNSIPATYAIINVPYRIGTSAAINNNYYRIQFDDPYNPGKPFKLQRNMLYQITTTITGFGQKSPPLDGTLLTDIIAKPWNDYSVNGDISYIMLNIASNQVLDFVNSGSGKIFFSTNQPLSKISIEPTCSIIKNDNSTMKVNVSNYLSYKIDLDASFNGAITVTPKGVNTDMKAIKLTINVSGVKRIITFSFRYVLDNTLLSTKTTRKSYNTWTGEVPTNNGAYLTYDEANNDDREPPYAKLEIAPSNTGYTPWIDARKLCTNGWRAPRIREARNLYKYANTARFNYTPVGNTVYSASEFNLTNYWFYTKPGADEVVSNNIQKNQGIAFRCVREI
ncbi:MAG: hypothetical protein RR513_03770 [Muribaculaceae bacterium]